MTEEEKKAIEYFKGFTEYTRNRALEEYKYENKNVKYAQDLEKRADVFNTLLNLIQKQQEEIEDANDITTDMSKDIKKLIAEIKIKDKIIDRMAIKIHTLDDNNTNYCDGKSNGDCEISHCKHCIIKYYREKVEKNDYEKNI